jgi:hypothetical protein
VAGTIEKHPDEDSLRGREVHLESTRCCGRVADMGGPARWFGVRLPPAGASRKGGCNQTKAMVLDAQDDAHDETRGEHQDEVHCGAHDVHDRGGRQAWNEGDRIGNG